MGSTFKCGDRVRDRISGMCGIVTERIEYLLGSPRCYVTSTTLHDGKPVSEWFEEGRLESVES